MNKQFWKQLVLRAVLVLACPVVFTACDDDDATPRVEYVYYGGALDATNEQLVLRARTDGQGGVDTLYRESDFPELNYVADLELDGEGRTLFISREDRIYRVNADGSSTSLDEIHNSADNADAIAFHAGKLYYGFNGAIWRMNPDGSSKEEVVSAADADLDWGLAISVDGVMYWSTYGAIYKRAVSATTLPELVIDASPVNCVNQMAYDNNADRVLFADYCEGVYAVNPDGSNLTLIHDQNSAPSGMAYSASSNRIFFGWDNTGPLQVVNATENQPADVFKTGDFSYMYAVEVR